MWTESGRALGEDPRIRAGRLRRAVRRADPRRARADVRALLAGDPAALQRFLMAVAILDIDGTLVDTNYQHAIAWYRAFRHHKLTLPIWRLHRHIGMGGDQLVPALAGDDFESEHGD